MAPRELKVRASVLALAIALTGAARQPTGTLVEQLRDPEPRKRADAAWALADATDVSSEGAEALKLASEDPEGPVREAATWALFSLRPALEPHGLTSFLCDTLPKAIKIRHPAYPNDAFARKAQGTVMLRILIGADGRVTRTAVVKSIPDLDAAAIACVKQWIFSPATKNGHPVPMVAEAPLVFAID